MSDKQSRHASVPEFRTGSPKDLLADQRILGNAKNRMRMFRDGTDEASNLPPNFPQRLISESLCITMVVQPVNPI